MLIKTVVFYLGCAASWLVLPVFVVGGVCLLLSYAVLAELGDFLTRNAGPPLDDSTARELAQRMCVGHQI